MKKITFFILVLFSLNLFAEEGVVFFFMDGNRLLKQLEKENFEMAIGIGYVSGLVDSLILSRQACITGQHSVVQVSDVALKYLKENPSLRHHSAASILIPEFQKNFPCN